VLWDKQPVARSEAVRWSELLEREVRRPPIVGDWSKRVMLRWILEVGKCWERAWRTPIPEGPAPGGC
jgi:hypothetical protein